VHLTGYIQPKDEWLRVIRSGQFDYHRIDVDEPSVHVDVSGQTAAVAGKGIFVATIDGVRADWRLQFTVRLARRGAGWAVAGAQYSVQG
jgi:hypothetical protein